jgi:branched-chain amino acid transport system permease protein
MIEAYLIHLLILVGIYSVLAVSLNLALGNTGLMNMGHIAFFGIGAYTSVIFTKDLGVPFFAAFLIAGLLTSVFGFILVYATRKLRGDYLALATLGFSFVIYSLMLNWSSVTRGPLGIPGISKPCFFGLCIANNLQYLIFVLIISAISIAIMYIIVNSSFGKLLAATRDDDIGLRALGKNTFMLKSKALMISAFFAGIAGSLFAHYITYIDPSSFMLSEVILIFTIVIVGGIASIKGSIVSTFLIILIPELLRFLNIPSSVLGPARQIIYALILLVIVLWRPKGLFGKIDLE